MSKKLIIPEEVILSKIYEIRGQKIMLDRDLAELYGVETRVLKQAVRRNVKRFPEDFMFEMTKEEMEIWRSQSVMSKEDKKGLRYMPFCFTEQGVTMLSCILNSDRAIEVNIKIIRLFTKMREMLILRNDFMWELEEIRKKIGTQDDKIEMIFQYLQQFIDQKKTPREAIGFKTGKGSKKKS